MKAKKITGQVRQGDVLITSVEIIPNGMKKAKGENGRIILARGEATGHHHGVAAESADWWKQGAEQYLNVRTAVPVVHQEHAPGLLIPGKKRVTTQRQYTPKAIQKVLD